MPSNRQKPPVPQTGLPASDGQMPTIEDVAAAARVSKTTVSHVLSGKRPVATATQAKVRRVIEELGFRPSALARGLNSARSHTVALMVPDVTNPFYPALARGLQDAVRDAGLLVLLADAGNSAGQERAFLIEAIERRVDGLVLSSLQLTPDDLQPAVRAGLDIISVGPQLAGSPADVVSADDQQIGADAGDHLAARAGRHDGFRKQMKARGLRLPESRVVEADFTRAGGRAAMERLLRARTAPSAVFCANDLMAIGALDAARAAGLSVPGDLAILGVDDIDAAALVSPARRPPARRPHRRRAARGAPHGARRPRPDPTRNDLKDPDPTCMMCSTSATSSSTSGASSIPAATWWPTSKRRSAPPSPRTTAPR
jgi:LacI family transcriptional regulator